MRPLPSLRFSIYMSVVCDKGKGRPLGELKATFGTALKVLQCSKTIMSYDQSQCVLLALCVCALGRGLTKKVPGLGQRRPPPPSEGGGVPPPYSPPNCQTPLGVRHWPVAAPVILYDAFHKLHAHQFHWQDMECRSVES